ncbi:MAG: YicC/YloC family endoribonuclease [Pseudomonadota bacterium]
MIRSMTAFAREEVRGDWGEAAWELRSVNHRYLDASLRLPEDFRALEPRIREHLSKRLGRGKVECQLRIKLAPGGASLQIDRDLLTRVTQLHSEVAGELGDRARISVSDLLRWPGVVEPPAVETDTIKSALLTGFEAALGELIAAREREGASITAMLSERCGSIEALVTLVKARLPEIIAGQRERLRERLGELREEVDADRLEQELVIFSQRVDVAEELDRLGSHVQEVRRALMDKKPVGRRLDFLMQELNREANTLGSKSADTQTTNAAVDLKVIIEQMREQVQNVE